MKKILYQNLIKDCLIFFLITLISATIIIWVFQAVNYLDIIVDDGRGFSIYLKYTFLSFPKILAKILPFIAFFSFYYVISKYETNNELIIFWIIGVNKIQFVNFFFKFSFILLIIQFFFTIYLVPSTQEFSRKIMRDSNINFFDTLVKEQKFNDSIKNLTIYIDKKENNGRLKNVYIKKKTDDNSFQITYAKEGMLVDKNGNQILELIQGETINEINNKTSTFSFSNSDFNFDESGTEIVTVNKMQETSTLDLLTCLNNLLNLNLVKLKIEDKFSKHNCTQGALGNIYKEIYKRLLVPLFIPILILISQFLIIFNKENANYIKFKTFIFLTGLGLIIFSETTLKFINNDFFENLKITLIPFILIISLYFYLAYIFDYKFKKNKK